MDSQRLRRRRWAATRRAVCRSGLRKMTVMSAPLRQFRAIVLEDLALQQELRRCPDQPSFVTLLIARAREHGCDIAPAEVEAALDAGAKAWIVRGVAQ